MLEDLGLVPALEALADQFGSRNGIDCFVSEQGASSQAAPISMAVATCLYRVTQEALSNAAKHAQARQVQIRLERAADGRICLRISDDGRGMSTSAPRKASSFGLLGMQERVRSLEATLLIESRPHAGTTIEVNVPPPDYVGVVASES